MKRVYQLATPKDGSRMQIDRYWPRGLRGEQCQLPNTWIGALYD